MNWPLNIKYNNLPLIGLPPPLPKIKNIFTSSKNQKFQNSNPLTLAGGAHYGTLNRITTNPLNTDTTRIHFWNTFFSQKIIAYILFYWHFFPSTTFSNLPYLSITSFNDFPHKTRSSAYNNSINEPSYTSSIRTSITMINKSELKADP